MHYRRVAEQFCAHDVTNVGMRAITADQIRGKDFSLAAIIEILSGRAHTAVVLHVVDDPLTVQHGQPRCDSRMGEHDRLQVELIDAMRRFRRRPPGVGTSLCRVTLCATWNRDACKLYSC